MATVEDVATYILLNRGPMSAMKLQKLCYYSQAWHLVWDEKPLFSSKIEAWANGPVVPDLYRIHRGNFYVTARDISGDPSRLDQDQVESIDAVLDYYGRHSARWLSGLTHREPPWIEARTAAGLGPTQRGNVEITHEAMTTYYRALTRANL